MTPDRNKTQLTRELTAAVITWLDAHGFKPIETECPVADAWIADVATMIEPTRGEATALKLLPRKPRYGGEDYQEWDRQYMDLPAPITALVEVKASVPDLKRDRKWLSVPAAALSFLAVPAELATLAIETAPAAWGIIQLSSPQAVLPINEATGELEPRLRVVRWPRLVTVSPDQRLRLIYNVALRRDHRSRYGALREAQKQARATDNQERVTPARWSSVVSAVLSIMKGGQAYGGTQIYRSVDDVLRANRVSGLPGWQKERLEALWGVSLPSTAAESGDTISVTGIDPA